MIWVLVIFVALVALGLWMVPMLGPESGRGARLWIALDDLRSEMKAKRAANEVRRELAERGSKSGDDA